MGGRAALELRLIPAAGSRYLPKREAGKFPATWVVPRQKFLPSQAGFRQGRFFVAQAPNNEEGGEQTNGMDGTERTAGKVPAFF